MVLNRPETIPASLGVLADMPKVASAGRVSPPPVPNTTSAGSRCIGEEPLRESLVDDLL
jgi:hypothetical protein